MCGVEACAVTKCVGRSGEACVTSVTCLGLVQVARLTRANLISKSEQILCCECLVLVSNATPDPQQKSSFIMSILCVDHCTCCTRSCHIPHVFAFALDMSAHI